jgi:hypothetical protein
MATTISENFLSRSFTLGQQAVRELIFDIHDATDETEAQTILLATAPSVYQGQVLDSINADPVGVDLWKGYARYTRLADDSEYTFDTGGGSQKITQSLATVGMFAPPGFTAPDFQGAIGVSDDKVEGAEIVDRKYQFTETHTFLNSAVTDAYKLALFRLTGRVNNATFKNFAAGESLFMGASGSKRGDGLWSITFRFNCSPNVTGLEIGGEFSSGYGGGSGAISGIDKAGWDYLWVRYADFEDSVGTSLVKRPVAAYVERVYEADDFADLGIGT